MAGPRQKKKNRSSRHKVRTGVSGRTKAGKKKVNFLGNEIIKNNWDNKLTLTQNYERLGLSVRLNDPTGGVEKRRTTTSSSSSALDSNGVRGNKSLKLSSSSNGVRGGKYVPGEVQIERDPATGAILRIVTGDEDADDTRENDNPLNDPLNDLDDSADDFEGFDAPSATETTENPAQARPEMNDIVRQLEAQAAAELEDLNRTRRPRQQSAREEDWIKNLMEKYGDDYGRMVRDRKLNPRQQTEGDIKRRVKKWQEAHG